MPPKPSSQLYLKAHYNREREPQTEYEIRFILDSFIKSAELENSEKNRAILSETIRKEYRGIFSMANLREVAYARNAELERKLKPATRPLGRTVEAAELEDWFKQIAAANQWFALTHRNLDIVSKIFLFDERLSPQHTLQDLVNAVKIANAEHGLDKNAPPPPPEPPKFPDDLDEVLSDGTKPLLLDATTYGQRKATVPQMKNLIDRLRRYEIWKREQEQQL